MLNFTQNLYNVNGIILVTIANINQFKLFTYHGKNYL